MVCIFTCILYIFSRSTVITQDTAWHIKVGEWIAKNHCIPEMDTFSYHADLSFMAHEWLYDLITYWIDAKWQLKGLYIMVILVVLFGYGFCIFRNKSRYQIPAAILLFLLTVSGTYKNIIAIPDTIAAVLVILNGYYMTKRDNTKCRVVIQAVLGVLLANLHGGMYAVAVIQSLYLMVASFLCYKEKSEWKQKVLPGAGFILGGFINPYFIGVFRYALVSNASGAEYIADYLPFQFESTVQVLVLTAVVVFYMIGYMKRENRKGLTEDFLLVMFYLLLLFRYMRTTNLFVYAVLLYMVPDICRGLETVMDSLDFGKFKKQIARVFMVFTGVIITGMSVVLLTHFKLPDNTMYAYIRENYLTENMLDYLLDHKVMNSLETGGYLAYLGIPVFIDGRTDVYSSSYGNPDILVEYEQSLYSEKLMSELSDKYGFDCLLLNNNSIQTQIFYASEEWMDIDATDYTVLFVKKEE